MFDTNAYYILLPYRERENVESLLEQSLNTPSNGDGYPVIPFKTDGYILQVECFHIIYSPIK